MHKIRRRTRTTKWTLLGLVYKLTNPDVDDEFRLLVADALFRNRRTPLRPYLPALFRKKIPIWGGERRSHNEVDIVIVISGNFIQELYTMEDVRTECTYDLLKNSLEFGIFHITEYSLLEKLPKQILIHWVELIFFPTGGWLTFGIVFFLMDQGIKMW